MPKSVWWLTITLALFITGNAIVLSVAVVIGENWLPTQLMQLFHW